MKTRIPDRKIGEGLQYDVFDKGSNRVLKIPKSLPAQIRLLKVWYMHGSFEWRVAREDALRARRRLHYSLRGIQRLTSKYPALHALLGNPTFLAHGQYEQDQATSLLAYLHRHDFAGQQRILRTYVALVHETWKYGFSDIVFNFSVNCGVDKQEKILLLDLGELSFQKREVARLIRRQQWLQSWSYQMFSDKRLQAWYAHYAGRHFTLQKLEQLWKSCLKQ